MFTGLVEEVGRVVAIDERTGVRRLTIHGPATHKGLRINDSIAVDGCCQTVIAVDGERFEMIAVEETLLKTTLGEYTVGTSVNLERPLRVGDRLGGHFVMGHVDCVGRIAATETREGSWIFWIEYPNEFAPLVIPVGSIAINGVSLTAARVEGNTCMVSIIPHTHDVTTFGTLKTGDHVNVEFDMVGKYIRNFVQS